MKTPGLIILIGLLPLFAPAQTKFIIEAAGLTNSFVLTEKPLKGKYLPTTPEKIAPDKKGRYIVELQDDEPGFMKLDFGSGRTVKVFIERGRTNSLSVHMDDFDKSLKFGGPGADQNEFINELKREAFSSPNGDFLTVRSNKFSERKPKDVYLEMLDNIDAEKKILHKKAKKKFSEAFVHAMEQEIVFYYTCLFSQMASQNFRESVNNHPSQFNAKWAYYWSKIFEIQPFNQQEKASSEYYIKALDYYLNDYRLGYLGDAIYEDPDLSIGEQFLEYDRLLWDEFKGPVLEYALAAVFSYRAMMGKNETVLFDLYNKFHHEFPNSIYLKRFENAVAPIGDGLKDDNLTFPEGIVQLDASTEINSIEDILNEFKGKVVYLDIWATWCSPCLFEFRQKKLLEEFVQGKDIVLVFVSVDNDDRKEKWQKTILDNNLRGYHLMANYSLRDQLIDKFGDGSNLALPHYIIYDKTGKLADGNAKQPSHNSLLFKDLLRYID